MPFTYRAERETPTHALKNSKDTPWVTGAGDFTGTGARRVGMKQETMAKSKG